jgi:hypothetical protein
MLVLRKVDILLLRYRLFQQILVGEIDLGFLPVLQQHLRQHLQSRALLKSVQLR